MLRSMSSRLQHPVFSEMVSHRVADTCGVAWCLHDVHPLHGDRKYLSILFRIGFKWWLFCGMTAWRSSILRPTRLIHTGAISAVRPRRCARDRVHLHSKLAPWSSPVCSPTEYWSTVAVILGSKTGRFNWLQTLARINPTKDEAHFNTRFIL